jgi:hypothetical protein
MFALISTIYTEQPYCFLQTSEVLFPVTEPEFFWVDCPAGVSPSTHTWDGTQFIQIPPAPPVEPPVHTDATPTVV